MVGQSVRCRTFIGRHRELSALVDARKALGKSSGSFVLISGDAGIGKSRILGEFVASSHDRRARNLVNTECLQRVVRPLGPIRAAIRALLPAVELDALPKTVLRALAQLVPEDLPAQYIAEAGGITLEKDQLFEAILDFFRIVCAKRATVLTIEDIHWANDSTIDFLAYLSGRLDGMRLLVVATYRTDELDRNDALVHSLAPLFREPKVRHVRLVPLVARELHELVEATLEGLAPAPEQIVHDIEVRSEGNPFFAEELVKDWLERDFETNGLAQLPISIRATISQRVSRLTPGEQQILEYAAVLGQRFDPELLALVMKRDQPTIHAALRRGRDLNLLSDEGAGHMTCRFRHALTRQTIYEDVPTFQSRTLHAEILSVLEGLPEADERLEELAYHAWRSGNRPKAATYNERAGEAAFSMRALSEALVCFERALESTTHAIDRARLYERIGAIERLQGRYQLACDALEAALNIRLQRGEFDDAARVATSLVGQLYNMDNDKALPYAESFLETHRASLSQASIDNMLVVCARIACALYDFAGAERSLSGVPDPEQLTPNARLNYLIVQLMRHAYAGNADEWTRFAKQVDQLLPRLTPEAVVGVENALALTGIYLGTNERIEAALATSARVERDLSFRAQRLYYAAVKAAYLYQRGRLDEAVKYLEEVASATTVYTAIRVAAPIAVHVAMAVGDESLWKRIGDGLIEEAREQLDDPDAVFLLAAHAALVVRHDELALAQNDLRAALAWLKFAAPEAMFLMIHAARFLEKDELGHLAELTRVAARQAGGAASRANDALVRAIIASRMGKEQEAVALADDAATRFAALGWPLFEAQSLELAGKPELARAIYERCGATEDFKRLEPGESVDELGTLTLREREIASLVVRGHKNEEIAKRLAIGIKTVEKHMSSAFRKLGIRSRAQLVAIVAGAPHFRSQASPD
jgi:DNA-binding NarL/FixJ family response regulator